MSEPQASDRPIPSTPKHLKHWLLIGGIGLVAGAGLFGLGWWQGHRTGQNAVAELQQQLSMQQADLDKVQAELAIARDQAALMRASLDLYRSSVELDQRNFGTANNYISAATTQLKRIEDSDVLDMEKIRALQTQLANTNLNLAVDLEQQRRQVLTFANQLNALIPAPPAAE